MANDTISGLKVELAAAAGRKRRQELANDWTSSVRTDREIDALLDRLSALRHKKQPAAV